MGKLLALASLVLCLVFPSPRASAKVPQGWSSLRQAPITMHFRERDAGVARALLTQGPGVLQRLAAATGLPAPKHVDVMLVGDAEAFRRLQPGSPPSWAAGTAWPEEREVWLRLDVPGQDPAALDRVFVHELSHVLLGAAFEPREPPRWLTEGLARVLAEEIDPQAHLTLLRGALSGSMPTLHELLDRWPRHSGRAALAYAQSQDFVAWLVEQGPQVLPTTIDAMRKGEDADRALIRATGRDLWTLEHDWKKRLTFWHMAFPVAASSGLGWFLLGGIFTFGALRKRAATRRRIAKMPVGRFQLRWVRTEAPDEDLWVPWPQARPATLLGWPHPPSSGLGFSPAGSPSSPGAAPASASPSPERSPTSAGP